MGERTDNEHRPVLRGLDMGKASEDERVEGGVTRPVAEEPVEIGAVAESGNVHHGAEIGRSVRTQRPGSRVQRHRRVGQRLVGRIHAAIGVDPHERAGGKTAVTGERSQCQNLSVAEGHQLLDGHAGSAHETAVREREVPLPVQVQPHQIGQIRDEHPAVELRGDRVDGAQVGGRERAVHRAIGRETVELVGTDGRGVKAAVGGHGQVVVRGVGIAGEGRGQIQRSSNEARVHLRVRAGDGSHRVADEDRIDTAVRELHRGKQKVVVGLARNGDAAFSPLVAQRQLADGADGKRALEAYRHRLRSRAAEDQGRSQQCEARAGAGDHGRAVGHDDGIVGDIVPPDSVQRQCARGLADEVGAVLAPLIGRRRGTANPDLEVDCRTTIGRRAAGLGEDGQRVGIAVVAIQAARHAGPAGTDDVAAVGFLEDGERAQRTADSAEHRCAGQIADRQQTVVAADGDQPAIQIPHREDIPAEIWGGKRRIMEPVGRNHRQPTDAPAAYREKATTRQHAAIGQQAEAIHGSIDRAGVERRVQRAVGVEAHQVLPGDPFSRREIAADHEASIRLQHQQAHEAVDAVEFSQPRGRGAVGIDDGKPAAIAVVEHVERTTDGRASVRQDHDGIDRTVRAFTDDEGAVHRPIRVEPHQAVDRHAVERGEIPADEHLAIGQNGNAPKRAVWTGPHVEGGVDRAVRIHADHGDPERGVLQERHASQTRVGEAADGEDLAVGLARHVGNAAGTGEDRGENGEDIRPSNAGIERVVRRSERDPSHGDGADEVGEGSGRVVRDERVGARVVGGGGGDGEVRRRLATDGHSFLQPLVGDGQRAGELAAQGKRIAFVHPDAAGGKNGGGQERSADSGNGVEAEEGAGRAEIQEIVLTIERVRQHIGSEGWKTVGRKSLPAGTGIGGLVDLDLAGNGEGHMDGVADGGQLSQVTAEHALAHVDPGQAGVGALVDA